MLRVYIYKLLKLQSKLRKGMEGNKYGGSLSLEGEFRTGVTYRAHTCVCIQLYISGFDNIKYYH